MLDKIAKLLNQAENAGTQEESDVFMQKAQQLADIHSVSLHKARMHTESKQRTVPIQKTIKIGDRGTRGLKTLAELFSAVAGPNGVKLLYATNGSRVYAYGYQEDIEMTEAIYASLLTQQARELAAFQASESWKNDTVYVEGYWQYIDYNGKPCKKAESYDQEWVESKWKTPTWLTARINFQQSYAEHIRRRLYEAKREAEAQMVEDDKASEEEVGFSTELVLASKREEVAKIFDVAASKAGVYEGYAGTKSNEGRRAGRDAASRASLSQSTAIGGVKGAIER